MLSVTKSELEERVTAASQDVRPGDLRFVVETEPWLLVFLRNVAGLFRRDPPQVWITARPAEYWPDALVHRPVAWGRMRQSFLGHTLVILFVYWITLLWLNRPQVIQQEISRTTLIHYQVSEYLPPVNTRREKPAPPARQHAQAADPEYALQEIVSIHSEHSSLKQTIVRPNPNLLTQDVPLPNIVAWTPIPGAPIASNRALQNLPLDAPLVVPPAEQLTQHSHLIFPVLPQPEAVAPAPAPAANHPLAAIPTAAPAVVPPPAAIATARNAPVLPTSGPVVVPPSERPVARRNALQLSAQAPEIAAPPAPVASRRALVAVPANAPEVVPPPAAAARRNVSAMNLAVSPQAVVPPPEPVAGGDTTHAQAIGQLLALNARPSPPVGPVSVPEGNRRGEFAAGPEGKPGATARPEIVAGDTTGGNHGGNESAPANIYVSAPPAKVPANAVVASAASVPRSRSFTPDRTSTASDHIDNQVFGSRRNYSIRLSMPNLNSAIGSWIMRFARLNSEPGHEEDISAPEPLRKVDPAYPASYVNDRIEGTVVLYAIIRSDGSVADVRVLEGFDPRLDENARTALSQWRFRPGTRNGVPVDVEAVVRVPFRVAKAAF